MYEPNICLYHAECTDGFGAAWAIWRAGRPASSSRPSMARRSTSTTSRARTSCSSTSARRPMCCAPWSTRARRGRSSSSTTTRARKKALAGLMPTRSAMAIRRLAFDGRVTHPRLVRHGEERRPLAWEFAHSDAMRCQPDPAHRGSRPVALPLPDTKEVIAAVNSYPQDFLIWDTVNRSFDALVDEGEPILRAQAAAVETMLKQAYSGRSRRAHDPAGQCAQAVFERRMPPLARDEPDGAVRRLVVPPRRRAARVLAALGGASPGRF
jgi:hypothetical protein